MQGMTLAVCNTLPHSSTQNCTAVASKDLTCCREQLQFSILLRASHDVEEPGTELLAIKHHNIYLV